MPSLGTFQQAAFQNFSPAGKHLFHQDGKDDLYASNIQIAELNAIAAEFMILKWKRMLGFYGDMTSAEDVNAIYAVQENTMFKMIVDDEKES